MKEISININGIWPTPEWAVAGTRGSFGAAWICLEFSPEWEKLHKRITFFPADGSDAVALTVEDDLVRVPDEVMAAAGTASFVIDGVREGEILITKRGELRVVDTVNPGGREPVLRTPSDYEQLRAELQKLKERII
ncbi:MAG: hypothetical protein ACI3XI_08770 [Eubacteriales bacterium]